MNDVLLRRLGASLLLALTYVAAHDACAAPPKSKKAVKQHEQGEFANFAQWSDVSAFLDEMASKHGFDRAGLTKTIRRAHFVDSAVQLVKPPPPGRPKNWRAYRERFIEPIRINAGIAFWDQYAEPLARAEREFGVPSEIIVGLIGVETIYGRNTGNFRVMDAITTLAFAYPDTPNRAARMTYFRGELENTLLFAREAGIDPFSLLGSYAGAIGWPQFMPGSIRKFAVDFDGDGKIDLRNSPVDAIGSVANFLVRHGWKAGEPLVFPVAVPAAAPVAPVASIAPAAPVLPVVAASSPSSSPAPAPAASAPTTPAPVPAAVIPAEPQPAWMTFLGKSLAAQFSLNDIKAAGISPVVEPPADRLYTLVDLQNGYDPTEYWLGTDNFFAIAQYNRSYFYAMSVIELGRSVKAARDIR